MTEPDDQGVPGDHAVDAVLAAYGDAVIRSHRPVDPRSIVDTDQATVSWGSIGDVMADSPSGYHAITPWSTDPRGRGRILMAVAASLLVLVVGASVIRATSSNEPTTVTPGGSVAPTIPARDSCQPRSTLSAEELAALPPGSVEITNPPLIEPEDAGPRRVVHEQTSPDGTRKVTITLSPADERGCESLSSDRPMLEVQAFVDGVQTFGSVVDPHWGPPAGLVVGTGSNHGPHGATIGLRTQPQVASLQLDIRQRDGQVLTETAVPHRSYAYFVLDDPEDLQSDLRVYDAAGAQIDTVARLWIKP